MMRSTGIALIAGLLAGSAIPSAAEPMPPPIQQLTRDVYKELIEINTTDSVGDTYAAAQAMAARLIAAGYPKADVQAFQSAPKRGNLIARLRGTGKRKPILLVAHLDVVEAKREDWTTDPFKLVEKDGYFYGRGTSDDKDMATAWIVNMIRWKREGYKPDRDLVLVLETDEELGDRHSLGIRWLIEHHRDLLDAAYAINEGGEVEVKEGKPFANGIQTAEKRAQSFWIEARNPGGHSSQPRKDNAIYELTDALGRLDKYEFPVLLNDTTRGFFAKMSTIESPGSAGARSDAQRSGGSIDHGQLAQDMKSLISARPDPAAIARLSAQPPYNAQIRTTCVATRLEGGHADNALPQLARAMINCRIVPGQTVAQVQQELERVFDDPKLAITTVPRDPGSEPSAMNPELLAAVEQLSAKFWPGVSVMPTMTAGATDGRFLRASGIPTYGHSGMATDIFDIRAHGKDERVGIQAMFDGEEYLYELVKALSGG